MNALTEFFTSNPLLFTIVIVWSIIWKGIALWNAARNNQLVWYIVLIVVNTAGLLEIIYLLFFRKKRSVF